MPFGKRDEAFKSGNWSELHYFVNCDSDGLGHPLPKEVCLIFGLAVAYCNNVIPNYNGDVVIRSKLRRGERRKYSQQLRRASKKHRATVAISAGESARLAPFRNSTIHFATAALVVRHWTGNWHYREQSEILQIMGLSKSQDFIRDRIDYLRGHNLKTFDKIDLWASRIKK